MKTNKCLELNENKILEITIALLINLIIFSANNKLMMYTKHLSLFVILLCVVLFVSKKEYSIWINRYKALYLAFVMIILISSVWVSSTKSILEYSSYFISGLCILFSDFSRAFYGYLIKIFKIIFWLFMFSMFLEALSPEAFHSLFGFASFGDTEMRALTSGGAIAGLAFEKAYAAFICNLGLGVLFAEFVVSKLNKYIIQSVVVMLALMMTGKRTLFIIPIVVALIYVILFIIK